ncbi:putative TBC1 domain family member 2A [Apostichopus japonicus]|uniref:Putative TBC1 domain family member 2A n=1 Tax=Stichopus japonicus TaxID=307972 RepID=A0A2G8JYF8_STIJA|nr:putative TBC1 domain family member 2A [Apostichopus japonicus]
MGIYWRGQVGVGHSQTRVQNRILLQPTFRGRRKADTHTHGPRQTLSPRRGNSGPAGQAGNYKSSGRDGTTLPVLLFSDQKTGRHLASHSKPKTPEHKTHQTKTLPYGDLKLNITPTQKGHVGGDRRLTGRLPAHLDTQEHRRFLAFRYAEQDYQFRALPFGLATAPRTFTRVAGAVVAYLRKRGVTLYVYLDDWLVVGNSLSEATNNVHKTLQTLQELGWIVNQKKSRLSPPRRSSSSGPYWTSPPG